MNGAYIIPYSVVGAALNGKGCHRATIRNGAGVSAADGEMQMPRPALTILRAGGCCGPHPMERI
jgi:hypothetical protein